MAAGYHERFKKLIDEIRPRIETFSTNELYQDLQEKNQNIVIIDVRERDEWDMSHIPKSLCLPKSIIERDIEYHVPNLKQHIVLYSREGYLSMISADNLMKMGYENVYSLKGGFHAWTIAGLPIRQKGETKYPEETNLRDDSEESTDLQGKQTRNRKDSETTRKKKSSVDTSTT